VIDGRLKVVFAGVERAMNVFASTRFGGEVAVKLPAGEVRAVYEHYGQFGRRPPQILKGWSPQEGWSADPSA